ncbi:MULTISPECIES: hypothetical protein [unclassified Streptomyces]|uniref:hypothetical protein n=1 Tax=unclassified Streptomyces TaxID=2593676 RepID=UPI003D8E7952
MSAEARGMAICHWNDPFISEFLARKEDGSRHWTTNISVEIDQDFIDALGSIDHPLNIEAEAVHELVVRGMLLNGEPGYWNSTYSNEGEVNEVIATNPCGEIALPETGACVLGHVNMDYFAPKTMLDTYDRAGLTRAHELMTRFLIRATYGDMTDDQQREVMHSERLPPAPLRLSVPPEGPSPGPLGGHPRSVDTKKPPPHDGGLLVGRVLPGQAVLELAISNSKSEAVPRIPLVEATTFFSFLDSAS